MANESDADQKNSEAVLAADYERLAQEMAVRLAEFFGGATETCQHNVVLEGRGTNNQIDVLWLGR